MRRYLVADVMAGRARREIDGLRERAYRRLIVSALRRDETWQLADHYAPPTARMMLDRGIVTFDRAIAGELGEIVTPS